MQVAVIGAGQAGRRFALRCVLAGFDVVLEDVMPANLRRAQAEFEDLSGHPGGHPGDQSGDQSGNPRGKGTMRFALTVEDAVREADIAIDFVPDELESKLEIFFLVDRMAPPKTVLCTPSEALSITDLASCTYRGERCFAVRGELAAVGEVRLLHPRDADAAALDRTRDFFETIGCGVGVEVDPDVPMLVKNATFG